MKLKQYSFLTNNKISFRKYSITPLRKRDIQKIRKWRNEQINILRQQIPLTKEIQFRYFANTIEKSFYKNKPDIILFSFLHDGHCIGYGGLVHMNWNSKRGEVSFVSNTIRTKSKIIYQKDFSIFLKLLCKISFDDMDLNKLTTETFDIRPWTIEVLEKIGFELEGKLKQHVNIKGKYVDSLIHKYLQEQYFEKNLHTVFNFNILVTSISKKISQLKLIKKANERLGNLGKIFGADSDSNCIGRYFVDSFWTVPPYEKLSIEKITSYCIDNKISCIIPTSDGELSFYAKHKRVLLNQGIHVMVSDYEKISICLDKIEFFKQLKNLKFPTIKTSTNIDNIKANYYVVKERFADFGTQSNELKLTKENAIILSKKFENPIFQPFIEGKEFSIDLYVDKKIKAKGCIIRTREMIQNGESQITESIENVELEKICLTLVEKLDLYGHIIMQVIVDDENNFNILECNNRFGGASSLSLEVGLDTFYWFLLEVNGADLNQYPFIRSKIQKKQIRYPENLILF